MDFAKRAHDHSFHIDQIVRSLLDVDFYKLLMLQFIWRFFPKTEVEFALMNRTKSVKLANIIDEGELIAQLNLARKLRFTERELIWLAGNKFYGTKDIFEPGFIQALRSLTLTDYHLSATLDGQYVLTFSGNWLQVSLWEIISIIIVNTLRNRAALAKMSKMELDILYARAKVKAHEKVRSLSLIPDLNLIDFGTRRRHDFLWQRWNVELYADMLGDKFTGTSNALLAMELGLEARGTNAHELPMVLTALAMYGELPWFIAWGADDDAPVHQMPGRPGDPIKPAEAQYYVLDLWQRMYGENLRVFLPDTYGTTQFLANAPDWLSGWKGARPDSKPPIEAVRELSAWWQHYGINPKNRTVLPCDGLDIGTIQDVHKVHQGKVGLGYGYGTWFSNDFRNCHPRDGGGVGDDLLPISLVCKISKVKAGDQWVPAVKLSDNFEKACGPADEVAKYREVFGTEGVKNVPVIV